MRGRSRAAAIAFALSSASASQRRLLGALSRNRARQVSRPARRFPRAYTWPIQQTGVAATQVQPAASASRFPLLLGRRLEVVGRKNAVFSVTPVIETSVSHTSHEASVFNPALFGQLAWDLGNGFGFSYALGAYFDVPETGAFSSSSLNQRFALSYTADGWNLTANAIYGIQFDSVASRPQISPCPGLFDFEGCNPDFFNIDLTATQENRRMGGWCGGLWLH